MTKLGIGSACLLLACSGTVDAGDRERWSESIDPAQLSSPQTLYEGSASILAYTVDDSRIYALVDDYALIDDTRRTVLRLVSCLFQQCAQSLTKLAEVPTPPGFLQPTSLHLSNGELFWIQPQMSNPGAQTVLQTVLSCSSSGCPNGARDVGAHPSLISAAHYPAGATIAVDADYIYWWQEQSVMRCSRVECQSPMAVAENVLGHTTSSSVLEYGSYLYLSSSEEIARVRKDGSEGVEVLTRSDSHIGSAGVGPKGLFFPSSVLTGGIWRCPMEGCGAGPESIVGGQRWPSALQLDDADVFWAGSEARAPYALALARCPQSGCEEAQVLASNLRLSGRALTTFVMNREYLFWAEDPSSALSSLRMVKK